MPASAAVDTTNLRRLMALTGVMAILIGIYQAMWDTTFMQRNVWTRLSTGNILCGSDVNDVLSRVLSAVSIILGFARLLTAYDPRNRSMMMLNGLAIKLDLILLGYEVFYANTISIALDLNHAMILSVTVLQLLSAALVMQAWRGLHGAIPCCNPTAYLDDLRGIINLILRGSPDA